MKKQTKILKIILIFGLFFTNYGKMISIEAQEITPIYLEILEAIPENQLPDTPDNSHNDENVNQDIDSDTNANTDTIHDVNDNKVKDPLRPHNKETFLPATGKGLLLYSASFCLVLLGLILKTERKNDYV